MYQLTTFSAGFHQKIHGVSYVHTALMSGQVTVGLLNFTNTDTLFNNKHMKQHSITHITVQLVTSYF